MSFYCGAKRQQDGGNICSTPISWRLIAYLITTNMYQGLTLIIRTIKKKEQTSYRSGKAGHMESNLNFYIEMTSGEGFKVHELLV